MSLLEKLRYKAVALGETMKFDNRWQLLVEELTAGRTDWFMTKDTLRLGKLVVKCGGVLPKLFPLSELRTTLEQRRDNGPYCLLGLFRKPK